MPIYECISQIPDHNVPVNIAVGSEALRSQNRASVLPELLICCLENILSLVQGLVFSSVKAEHYKSAMWDCCDPTVEI